MRRVLVAVLVATVVGGASYAFAATLLTTSKSLAAGKAAVTPCDSDGFTYTRTLNSSKNVTSVTVSGINAACSGGTLKLTLAGASNSSLGTGSAAVTSSGAVTVSITGTAPAASVNAYHAAITN